jgi:alkaline ceramidase
VTSLGRRTILFWIVAVVCWINDKLYCEIWSALGFPYLHGFWHVLIFLVTIFYLFNFKIILNKKHHPIPWRDSI